MTHPQYAWHFTGPSLRDGSPIPADNVWLTHPGPYVMCQSGLHASREPFDALQYAPGATLCYVEIAGIAHEDKDKLVCARRKIIARMDANEMLRYYARMQALSVIHFWGAPDVVLDYLMTGDEGLRDAARAAARDAAWDAARDAARSAAWDTARDAAWDAARAAAWDDFDSMVFECFKDFLP